MIELEDKEINLNEILFSDEAHFYVDNNVSQQNHHLIGCQNSHPNFYRRLHLQPLS
jgi:hypothetical protein